MSSYCRACFPAIYNIVFLALRLRCPSIAVGVLLLLRCCRTPSEHPSFPAILQLYRENFLWLVDYCIKSLMEGGVCDLHMLILANIVWFVTVAETTHPWNFGIKLLLHWWCLNVWSCIRQQCSFCSVVDSSDLAHKRQMQLGHCLAVLQSKVLMIYSLG